MMDMMKKGAALMGAALLTVTLWSTPVMAAVNVPANLAAVSKTVKGAAPYGVYFSDLKRERDIIATAYRHRQPV